MKEKIRRARSPALSSVVTATIRTYAMIGVCHPRLISILDFAGVTSSAVYVTTTETLRHMNSNASSLTLGAIRCISKCHRSFLRLVEIFPQAIDFVRSQLPMLRLVVSRRLLHQRNIQFAACFLDFVFGFVELLRCFWKCGQPRDFLAHYVFSLLFSHLPIIGDCCERHVQYLRGSLA